MNTVRMERVTIIGDDTVKYRIVKELNEMGATGYTDCAVHGKGARGLRPRHAQPANAKIEVISTPEMAQRIFEHIARNYFDKYAMIAFLTDVEGPTRRTRAGKHRSDLPLRENSCFLSLIPRGAVETSLACAFVRLCLPRI